MTSKEFKFAGIDMQAVVNTKKTNITVRGFSGGTQVLFITVSPRDVDYSELDGAAVWLGASCIINQELADWLREQLP